METEKDYKIVEAMERYGGSFVQALATCFRTADNHNFKRLKETFAKLWTDYEQMLETKKVGNTNQAKPKNI